MRSVRNAKTKSIQVSINGRPFIAGCTPARRTITDAVLSVRFCALCSVRFRAPNSLFTLDLPGSCTVAEMKILIESKIGLTMNAQRLYFGQPKREIFGRDNEPVSQVLDIKEGEEMPSVTIEQRGKGEGESEAGGSGEMSLGDEEISHGQAVFLAYMGRGSAAVAPASVAAAAAPTAAAASSSNADPRASVAASTDGDEEDEFFGDDDGGGAGDWGDDGGDGGDADEFFGDDQDEVILKAKQLAEEKNEAESKKHLQSSAKNTVLGAYDILSLPTLLDMMKHTLSETCDTLGCEMQEAAILMRHYKWSASKHVKEQNSCRKVARADGSPFFLFRPVFAGAMSA
jgi:hypothetical protein